MLASAGITALLKKMDYKDVVVAIDGSLFRSHITTLAEIHQRIMINVMKLISCAGIIHTSRM